MPDARTAMSPMARCRRRAPGGMLLLLSLAAAAPVSETSPLTVPAINRAMAASADWRGTVIRRLRGCFPLISEDDRSDPAHRDLYCAADGAPLPRDAAFIAFAIRPATASRRAAVLVGELGGACPAPASVARIIAARLPRRGIRGMFDGRRRFLGDLGQGEGGAVLLYCSYTGRIGAWHAQATAGFTYDAAGYRVRGPIRLETFDANGALTEPARTY